MRGSKIMMAWAGHAHIDPKRRWPTGKEFLITGSTSRFLAQHALPVVVFGLDFATNLGTRTSRIPSQYIVSFASCRRFAKVRPAAWRAKPQLF